MYKSESILTFRNERIHDQHRLLHQENGLFVYDLRDGEDDTLTAENKVLVNYAGTIICSFPLFDPNDDIDYYQLNKEETEYARYLQSFRQEAQRYLTQEFVFSYGRTMNTAFAINAVGAYHEEQDPDNFSLPITLFVQDPDGDTILEIDLSSSYPSLQDFMELIIDYYCISDNDTEDFIDSLEYNLQ